MTVKSGPSGGWVWKRFSALELTDLPGSRAAIHPCHPTPREWSKELTIPEDEGTRGLMARGVRNARFLVASYLRRDAEE